MRLKQIHSRIANSNEGNIYLFGKSESYMMELIRKYPEILKNIAGIFDDAPRNIGDFSFEEIDFQVKIIDQLGTVDWSNNLLVITSDYYQEAYEKIVSFFEMQGSNIIAPEVIYFFPNRETEIDLSYRKKYENTSLQDIIVFRSGPHASSYVRGLDFADNARALFEYMLFVGLNQKYELVWLVKDSDDFILPTGKYYRYYRDYKNLSFVAYEDSISENLAKREEYYRVLCLAKWIFMTDAYGFARNCREDQVRVQLWHGCGFKTRINFIPCEKRYEYNIVISDLYKRIHADIYGLRDDQVLVTGYPKSDWLFQPAKKEIAERLGAASCDEKVVFWLPTFRIAKSNLSELNEHTLLTATGLPIIEKLEDLKKLNIFLKERKVRLIIKLHPFQDRAAISAIKEQEKMDNIILLDNEQLVDEDVQIGQLLEYADALISDYSSVAVEYLLLNRPIAFTLDDASEYENSRGFVFENIKDWLPGKELYNFDDFLKYLQEIADGVDSSKEKRKQVANQMHFYKDDRSSERVVKALGIK